MVTNRLLQFGDTESTDITLEGREGGVGTSTNGQWGGDYFVGIIYTTNVVHIACSIPLAPFL
jgi:hypothetical protein